MNFILKNYIVSKENRFKKGMDNYEITILRNSWPKMNFVLKGLYILDAISF